MTGSYMIITLTFKNSLGKAKQMMFKQMRNSKTVVRRYSAKIMFLNISQNSQENTCARVFLLIFSFPNIFADLGLGKKQWV